MVRSTGRRLLVRRCFVLVEPLELSAFMAFLGPRRR
jgi:hypothetical protein